MVVESLMNNTEHNPEIAKKFFQLLEFFNYSVVLPSQRQWHTADIKQASKLPFQRIEGTKRI